MENHVITYFTNIFCFVVVPQDLSMMDDVIPSMVDTNMNHFLIGIPYLNEVKMVVFNLRKTVFIDLMALEESSTIPIGLLSKRVYLM